MAAVSRCFRTAERFGWHFIQGCVNRCALYIGPWFFGFREVGLYRLEKDHDPILDRRVLHCSYDLPTSARMTVRLM